LEHLEVDDNICESTSKDIKMPIKICGSNSQKESKHENPNILIIIWIAAIIIDIFLIIYYMHCKKRNNGTKSERLKFLLISTIFLFIIVISPIINYIYMLFMLLIALFFNFS